ncbi:GyrI-like domain-containing protein [Alteribacter natronophilus]|uniref:GyrI-like domain-containing protein n=1 Tax=Alteribacter natronophilus TaxID=2583810 RepID=UPI0014871F88|nr:effector binding domain-containing protein [Alteribacter natronophilus]
MEEQKCEIIRAKRFHFVGIIFSGPFPSAFPEAAVNVQNRFEAERHKVQNVIRPELTWSPHYENEVLSTYWACSEVSEIESVPEPMTGFTLLEHDYGVTRCTAGTINNGYKTLHSWIAAQGREWNRNSCSIECFYNRGSEGEEVRLYVPLKEDRL